MKAIRNCRVVFGGSLLEGMAVIFDDKIIGIVPDMDSEIPEGCEVIDGGDNILSPGLIDIHTHGYLGYDVSNCGSEKIKEISEAIAANGVTSWLPTTMTVPIPQIEEAFDSVRAVKEESKSWNGAEILGVNCEGPFIAVSKKGAQKEEDIKKPDPDFILKHSDIVKIVTVAPEEDDNLEFVKKVKADSDIVVSVGHTAADYATAKAAMDAGATHVTHLFNAQTGLTHRAPGVVGAALTDDDTAVELIGDTYHVDKALFGMISKLKGSKLILITDCAPCGGMPEGRYMFGGQPIYSDGIVARLTDGVTLAGSVLKMNVGLRNFKENTSMDIPDIIALAAQNPAKEIGALSKGDIETGKDADLVLFDDDFNVIKTIKRGKVIYG